MILVSACLLGEPCRYDGKSVPCAAVCAALVGQEYLPICPECAGELATPRQPCEIIGGDGAAVLAGQARVQTAAGQDCTAAYLAGAQLVLKLAQQHAATLVILKEKSPSCGSTLIYDGTFSRTTRSGCGVCAALLADNNFLVKSENDLD